MMYFKISVFTLFFTISSYAVDSYDLSIQLDNHGNMAEKINKIIESNKGKKIKISLMRDKYSIDELGTFRHAIRISQMEDLTLDANGSLFIIEKPLIGLIDIEKSNNIEIKNLTIDYKILPHASGKIVSMDKEKQEGAFIPFSTEVETLNYNLRENIIQKIYAMALVAPGIAKEGKTGVTFIFPPVNKIDDKFVLKFDKSNNLEKGDMVIVVFRNNKISLVKMNHSTNIKFSNITVFAAPSAVFVGHDTSSAFFQNCRVLLKDGRYISSNADVFHFQSARKGPIIINSIMEGVGDDIINLYSVPMYGLSQTSNSLVVGNKNFIIKEGDTVDFFDAENGEIFHSSHAKLVYKIKEGYQVIFDEKIPMNINLKTLHLYDKNCTSDGFMIKNSIFSKSRRYGIYIKATNGKIIGNTFSQLGGSAIAIKNEPTWPEGLNSENILIQGNQISDCAYGLKTKEKGMIEIKFLKLKGLSKQKAHRNIQIIDNKINGNEQHYLIRNVENLILEE